MSTRALVLLIGFACLALAPAAPAQDTLRQASTSLCLGGGLSWPVGAWAESRINPSVNFFSMGPSFQADLDVAIGRRWTLALGFGYTSLSGKEWEDYVASKGERVSVSASTIHFALLLRPHLLINSQNMLRIELGPALLLADGSETYQGRAYTYDFLPKTAFGVRGGVEYTRFLTESIGVSVNAAIIVFPSGVQYIDRQEQTIISLPVTLGLRFLF